MKQYSFIPYITPFVLFAVVTSLEQWEPVADYYPWIYSFKAILVLGVWWMLRKRFPAPSKKGLAIAVPVGIVGGVIWILLSELKLETALYEVLPGWLNSGLRVGYNPFDSIASPTGQWTFFGIRCVGLVVMVPLMEEVFWRGFLIRWLIQEDFENVPIGRLTPWSFVAVTLLFTAVHPELLAAAIWCAAINFLLRYTKNLWACIVAHMLTNACLGIYIIANDAWWLW